MGTLIAARDYEGFRALLDNRRKELHISMNELGHRAGLTQGHANKLLSSPRQKGDNYQRNFGPESLGKLLAALSVEITITPRVASRQSLEGKKSYPQAILLAERARRGGLARAAKLTKEQRRSIAQKAALARWNKCPAK